MLTVTGAKLVTLVLNALHGLMLFYEKDYTQLNVDGLFGLRVIEGQLKHMWTSLESASKGGIPPDIVKDIKNMSIQAGLLANKALPHVYNEDPTYFKQFKYLVNEAYDIMHEHKLTDPKLLWPPESELKPTYFDESDSDKCIGEMLKAVSERAAHPLIEDPLKPQELPEQRILNRRKRAPIKSVGDGCGLTKPCLKLLLSNPGASQYKITHQILYVSVGELTDCRRDLDDYLMSTGLYNKGVDGFLLEYCTNLLREMHSLARKEGNTLTGMKRDLFMEMVFTCGQFGFIEFVQMDWLEWILNWQDSSGCYAESEGARTNMSTSKEKDTDTKDGPKRKPRAVHSLPGARKLMVEKSLKDNCLSHASAVASGALTIFLRFLLEPGPKEWSHLRIDLQRSASRLKSRHQDVFKRDFP